MAGWFQNSICTKPKFIHRVIATSIGFCLLFACSYISTNFSHQNQFPQSAMCPPLPWKSYVNSTELIKLHVLLLSYPRSGSSFLGDLLQSYRGAFYHFEPLHYFGNTVPNKQLKLARKLLHDIFHCNFHDWSSFPEWAWFNSDFLTFRRNKRYWQTCTEKDASRVLCYNVCFLAASCHNRSVQLVKTIRMAVSDVLRLLDEYKDLNLKVIHLVRDPRGTMNSRKQKDIAAWCGKYKACASPRIYCSLVNEDLNQACQLQKHYLKKYITIRYEDLALDPHQTTEKIFRFLGIGTVPREVVQFLETHTQGDIYSSTNSFLQPPYRTVRNSTQAALEWSRKMKLKEIQNIQNECQPVLSKLGYKLLNNASDLNVGSIMEETYQICPESY